MSEVIPVDFRSPSTSQIPLLVSRSQACAMLGGISISHLRRMMKAGELRPVFLNASATPQRSGKLYFRVSDLEALVEKYAKRAVK
ncbi:helix-turn-helix domain-containing protein [Bradyrhizobium cenepequi]|uniref:helix-turn-helix domain-containing protein n=1 Tax=Bradyrhizobium cenepequi TaxID=2821403 RepID=UPI001CE2AA5D|nr:helix-turn-helix domain-containing protein [Bradyrhizobium cenepequi]MCA6106116.1 helix-turn-helix domain-containing protein [Bradyrhizobium cenepequi]